MDAVSTHESCKPWRSLLAPSGGRPRRSMGKVSQFCSLDSSHAVSTCSIVDAAASLCGTMQVMLALSSCLRLFSLLLSPPPHNNKMELPFLKTNVLPQPSGWHLLDSLRGTQGRLQFGHHARGFLPSAPGVIWTLFVVLLTVWPEHTNGQSTTRNN